jgi:hypothetical protein
MDLTTWTEIQEGLLYSFGPILFWWLVVVVVVGVLSVFGVVILELVSNMTR